MIVAAAQFSRKLWEGAEKSPFMWQGSKEMELNKVCRESKEENKKQEAKEVGGCKHELKEQKHWKINDLFPDRTNEICSLRKSSKQCVLWLHQSTFI